MTNYAYLRISTEEQDVDNQKLGVLEYCSELAIAPLTLVEDTVSSRKPWAERKLGEIVSTAKSGDKIVVSEISRIARSTLEVLEVLQEAACKGISVHIAKNRMVMDGSVQSTIVATVLGLAAQIGVTSRNGKYYTLRPADSVKLRHTPT